jgi:hypothetical protein
MKNLAPNKGENKQNQHNDFEMKKIRTTHELLKEKKNEEPPKSVPVRNSFFMLAFRLHRSLLSFFFLFVLFTIFLFSRSNGEVKVNLPFFILLLQV